MRNKEIYKEKTKETFDKQAKIYDATYYGKHASKLYTKVIDKVEGLNCSNVLDVGCGTGNILSLLANEDNLKLFGMDFSQAMLDKAKEKLKDRAELKFGDSEHIPWEDNHFDGLICTDSFHHYTEPKKVLKEMARVLRPNGSLIIGDPWLISPFKTIGNWSLKFSKGGDYRIYSKKEITELLIDCGFDCIDWKLVNLNSFILSAKIIKY
ncbi:class I SAM-dependent methyltransferase [Clostridium manihotivorum]|uniref:SAM-dependent methyltransferase n=1 Tax=Clostridium manihotivorum TaxID=2320868 RepID=A0A410DXR0_9CLOT|nr:class I SAM-dependent methyltransferase [Clostridium manihotivorum]QAA34003.1 SAM-dependent methyltransferase [Clostridium manihotivorum]